MVLMDLQSRGKPWSKNTFTLRTTLTLSLKTGGREKSHVFQVTFFLFFFLLHSVPASQTSVDDVSSKTLTFHLCICVCVFKTRGCFNCTFCSCSLLRWVWSVVCVCVTHQSQRWPLVSCVLCKNLSEIKTINKEIILSSWLALTEIILLHSTCTVHEHTHTRTQKSTCWVFADRNDLEENLF